MPTSDELFLDGIRRESWAYLNLIGQDKWTVWTPAYSFATATSLTVTGRYLLQGRVCHWWAKSTGTSLATTAGTSYITMPLTVASYGSGHMANLTTHVAVGTGPIESSGSKFYPPTQAASGNDFLFAGWFEV